MDTNKYIQAKIALLTLVGFVLFVICDFWYYFDWFKVSKVIFIRDGNSYSLQDIILNSDNFILLFFLFWSIKKSTPEVKWMKYFCSFVMDLLFTSVLYTIVFSPDVNSWSRWSFLFVSLAIFVCQMAYNYLRK